MHHVIAMGLSSDPWLFLGKETPSILRASLVGLLTRYMFLHAFSLSFLLYFFGYIRLLFQLDVLSIFIIIIIIIKCGGVLFLLAVVHLHTPVTWREPSPGMEGRLSEIPCFPLFISCLWLVFAFGLWEYTDDLSMTSMLLPSLDGLGFPSLT